ncbi:Uncharacterised protein [BD1-7 clade bacterium]|uniref:LysM domain-containing protein n=1 Tax=BD1-7 clade bacterium TaxID=2029982 RepID=A0A5S9QFG1_9GAMM|nr:Uncharacterised protein [BD1-7 clade bacterium]
MKRFKRLLIGALLVIPAFSLLADSLRLRSDHPNTYYVKKGDTLWDISATFLENPWRWPEIWHINKQIDNPHLIFPGDKLALIKVTETNPQTGDEEIREKLTVIERGPIILGPGHAKITPQIRTERVDQAIPTIPLDQISVFLSKSRVEDVETLNNAPYVIAGDGTRIVAGAGDIVYARGNFDEDKETYGIYRPGKLFEHPKTGEVLGVQSLSIGTAKIIEDHGDIRKLEIETSSEEVRITDRLLPAIDRKIASNFFPRAPESPIDAEIIAVEGGVSQVGTLNVVVLSAGEREGLVRGDVLSIRQAGEVVKDRITNDVIQLPSVESGLLIVFRTFEKMSYGLIVDASRPLEVGDLVTNPR